MISIINEPKANRNTLSWQIVRDAISKSENVTAIKPREYDLLTSDESRAYFCKIPKKPEEWDDLITSLRALLFTSSRSLRAVDSYIISLFLIKYMNGYDVSDFFKKTTSKEEARALNCAKVPFVFNDDKDKDEELY